VAFRALGARWTADTYAFARETHTEDGGPSPMRETVTTLPPASTSTNAPA